jgi:hypothetical protein
MMTIMWLFSWLPDFFWHLLLGAGIVAVLAATVLKRIPFVSSYRIPLQYGGIAAVIFSVWMEGGIANEAKWQARVKELEAKIAVAEAKSKEENVKIVNKVITKTEYYKERGNDIVQYVDREITKYDNTCPIPNEVVKAHNDAATPGDKK